MNLTELTNHVCTSTGYSQADDVLACKAFLQARDRMIYNSALWKDSLVLVPMTMDPDSSEDHAAGIVLLPEVVGRPVALRSANNSIRINPLEYYHRIDLDRFSSLGNPYEFSILSPTWFTVRPTSNPYTVTNVTVSGTYGTVSLPGGGLGASSILASTTAGAWYRLTPGANENAFSYDALLGSPFTALTPGVPVIFQAAISQIRIVGLTLGLPFSGTLEAIPLAAGKSSGAGATLTVSSSESADTAVVKVIWRDLAGRRYQTSSALPSFTLTPPDDAGFFDIEAVFKPTTTGTVSFTLNDSAGQTFVEGTLAPTVTRSPSYQRLRLFNIPEQSLALNVLGKGAYQPLDYATQEPLLRNAEDVLIAFARGDLLRRGGENGNAQLAFQEAAALLQQLKDLESIQAANSQRIIPEDGFGPEWGLGPTVGLNLF